MDNISFEQIWKTLSKIDCSTHTEEKVGGKDKFGNVIKLTYLSWTWAWGITMKYFPSATFEVKRFDGKLYNNDPLIGIMVETSVTIGGNTRSMWLPVMDGANNAQKQESYTYNTKYGEKTVQAADMMGVNKAIMRCLVKNLALFGLGLNIYAGEDLPVGVDDDKKKPAPTIEKTNGASENPAKPSAEEFSNPAPTVTKKPHKAKPNPRAAAAWKEFKTLDQVKNLNETDRNKAWENLLFTTTGKTGAAQIDDDALWDKVDNEIGIMKVM